MPIKLDPDALSSDLGAARPVKLPATQYRQGQRKMFHIVTSLAQLPQVIAKIPNPDETMPGNRRVDRRRAERFGSYLIEEDNWVSPAIIVRAPDDIEFKMVNTFEDGTAWGELTIPIDILMEILVLDGQHRTLGVFKAIDELNKKIREARNHIEGAEKNGNDDIVPAQKNKLKKLQATRKRFTQEHLSVDIAVVTEESAKQMFADINNNAKGVNPDFTTILDQRDVVNRIAVELIDEHPLLKGRVETGQETRMSTKNPNLMGAKTVANLVRTVHVGVSGRVGARKDEELSKNLGEAVEEVRKFLDLLVAGFEDLQAIIDGHIDPMDLKLDSSENKSMISSSSMLRALAGVYYEVSRDAREEGGPEPMSRSQIELFFRSLAPKLREVPVTEDNEFWMSTEAFVPDSRAPQAMQGALSRLVRSMVKWARDGNPELQRKPVAAAA